MGHHALHRARLLIATLWVGSLWTVGYVVAPTLFASLADRVLAGTIAGSLFRTEAWLSLVCGLLLFLLTWRTQNNGRADRTRLLWLMAAMVLCTLGGYFGLQPLMAAIRENAALGGAMAAEARMHFGILHGVASGVFLIQSLLGGVLILTLA